MPNQTMIVTENGDFYPFSAFIRAALGRESTTFNGNADDLVRESGIEKSMMDGDKFEMYILHHVSYHRKQAHEMALIYDQSLTEEELLELSSVSEILLTRFPGLSLVDMDSAVYTSIIHGKVCLNILNLAAQKGNIALLQKMASVQGINLNQVASEGVNAMFSAAYHNQIHAVNILFALGANVNAPSYRGRTPLIAAIMSGNLDMFWHLFSKLNANIHLLDQDDTTLAHYAALYNHPQLLIELSRHGVDINRGSLVVGLTPAGVAAITGGNNILLTLDSLGADVETADIQGRSTLSLAQENRNTATCAILRKLQKQKDTKSPPSVAGVGLFSIAEHSDEGEELRTENKKFKGF